jgi:subtilisin family serine protease
MPEWAGAVREPHQWPGRQAVARQTPPVDPGSGSSEFPEFLAGAERRVTRPGTDAAGPRVAGLAGGVDSESPSQASATGTALRVTGACQPECHTADSPEGTTRPRAGSKPH